MRSSQKVESILREVRIKDVLQVLRPGSKLLRKGKNRCPLHADTNPSFVCSQYKGVDRWRCFSGCGSGNVLDLLVKSKVVGNHGDGVRWLLDKELLDPTRLGEGSEKSDLFLAVSKYFEKQKLYVKFKNLASKCLTSDSPGAIKAREYFAERGLGSLQVLIDNFDLGFYDVAYFKDREFTPEEAKELGLPSMGGKENLNNSIVFMYHQTFGAYSAIKLRPLKSKELSKTFVNKEKVGRKFVSSDLGFFGLNAIDNIDSGNAYDTKDVILVEGEFDVLIPQAKALVTYGKTFNILCRSGSAATEGKPFEVLANHGYKSICIWADCDQAGRNFIKAICQSALPKDFVIDILWPKDYEPGQDPAEICKSLSATEIDIMFGTARAPLATYVSGLCLASYAGTEDLYADETSRRIDAYKRFSSIAEEHGTTDSINHEISRLLEERLPDSGMPAEIIYSELKLRGRPAITVRVGRDIYSADSRCYRKYYVDKDTDEGSFDKITNFVIKYDTVIEDKEACRTEIEGRIIVDEVGEKKFSISTEELSTPDSFYRLVRTNVPTAVSGLENIRKALPEIVSMANKDTSIYVGLSRVGYIPDTRIYATPSTLIKGGEFTPNEHFRPLSSDATAYKYFKNIDFTERDLTKRAFELGAESLIQDFFNCLEKKVTLVTLGHVMCSVMSPYFSIRQAPYILFLRGLAGSYKSTFAKVCMSLFYQGGPQDQSILHANDTINSIQTALSYIDHAPMVLDDIKLERENGTELMALFHSLHDEQGRSRLNRDYTIKQGRPIRTQGFIVTGENVVTQQKGALSRMIQIDVKKSAAKKTIFSKLLSGRISMRPVTAYFIRWLQTKYADRDIDLDELEGVDEEWKNSRAYIHLRKVYKGLSVFLDFLEESEVISGVQKEEYLREAEKGIKETLKENIQKTHVASKEENFLNDIRGYLASDIFTVTGGSTRDCYEIGSLSPDKEHVFIFPSKLKFAFSRVERPGTATIAPYCVQVLEDLCALSECTKVSTKRGKEAAYKFKADSLLQRDEGEF